MRYRYAKLKSVKWEYIAYPPGYNGGKDNYYTTHKTLDAAKKKCEKMGSGSHIMRTRIAKYADGCMTTTSPNPAEWFYNP